jgi:hypothetical protein
MAQTAALVALALLASRPAEAAPSCSVFLPADAPDERALLERDWCHAGFTQPGSGTHWTDFGFNGGEWQGMFAPTAPCDVSTAYGKAMATFSLLRWQESYYRPYYALPAGMRARFDGYTLSARAINDLRPSCEDTSVVAKAVNAHAFHQHVELHLPWFRHTIWSRAATVVHEARHLIDNKGHDGGAGCTNRASCDSSWEYDGANRWQVEWLASVAWNVHLPMAVRVRAQLEAGERLDGRFVHPPSWRESFKRAPLPTVIPPASGGAPAPQPPRDPAVCQRKPWLPQCQSRAVMRTELSEPLH